MDNISTTEIILGILYITAFIALSITAYQLMLKRFKRNKLEALNTISLITSRQNIFSSKTQFLIVSPTPCHVTLDLLDQNEHVVQNLVDQEITSEELPFDFDPSRHKSGKYYLYLRSDSVKIMRGITIAK